MTEKVIRTGDELVNKIIGRCAKNTAFANELLRGTVVNMSKADFMRAYIEICMQCNGDRIVRLDENGEPSENPDGLIPKSWAWTTVAGDARQILIGIVTAQEKNDPIYARLTEEGNVLEFNHDTFGDDGCFSPELCEYRKLSDREWIDFLADQFDISGTSAEGMLCSMKRWKKEHSFDAGFKKADFLAGRQNRII